MWARVKKIILSLSVIVLFALYALQKQAEPGGGAALVAALLPTTTTVAVDRPTATTVAAFLPPSAAVSGSSRPSATATASAATSNVTSSNAQSGAKVTATATGVYRDGTYTGSQADAHWGTVEVLAVISNGKISDVQFAQYPNHRSRSQDINSQAIPVLTQEAIQSQQAQVDVVSGATDTSDAFIQSLSSALNQATS